MGWAGKELPPAQSSGKIGVCYLVKIAVHDKRSPVSVPSNSTVAADSSHTLQRERERIVNIAGWGK